MSPKRNPLNRGWDDISTNFANKDEIASTFCSRKGKGKGKVR